MAVAARLRTLTPEQVERFHREGFIRVEHLLTRAEVAALAARSDLIASGKAEYIPQERIRLEPQFRDHPDMVEDMTMAVRKLAHLANFDDVLRAHALNTKLVDVVADLLDTDDLKLYGDQLFMKPAYHGSALDWHQDSGSFVNMFPMDLVTAWTAVDDATVENGCLHFVPGSHTWGVIPKHLLPMFEAEFGPHGAFPAVPNELTNGSVSFHHSLTLHASGPNATPHRRRGYATHYMRAHTIMDPQQGNIHRLSPFIQARGRSFPGWV
jgi:ectoine hydroxylase-related dioxygenase (phytanoyl-CoA dioxygenase family)